MATRYVPYPLELSTPKRSASIHNSDEARKFLTQAVKDGWSDTIVAHGTNINHLVAVDATLEQLKPGSFPLIESFTLSRVRRALNETGKFYTCPECEANFPEKALKDGKIPPHKFNGQPCLGAGQQGE